MRELSSLIDLQVISITEGKRLGTVADALVDLAAGELVCVILARTPELQVVLADDIEVIGSDALMVSGRDKIRSREDLSDELERGKSVLGTPPAVMTSRGTQLGRLGPVHIEEGSHQVVRFEITGGPLKDVTEGVLALPVLEGTVHGEDTVIVPHDVVAQRLTHGGGIRGGFRTIAERLKGGYADISERSEGWLRDGSEKIKVGAGQARERADELTKAAREKADRLASDAKDAVGEVREAANGETDIEVEVEVEAEVGVEADQEAAADQETAAEESPEATETPEASEVPPAGIEPQDETHLVPGPATPLPEGAAEETEEAAPSAEETRDCEGD